MQASSSLTYSTQTHDTQRLVQIYPVQRRFANVSKVGGLPLVELNHLELQFLLLNDFRLAVPLEEMEAYGTMLVEFYAREVAEQHERERASKQQ